MWPAQPFARVDDLGARCHTLLRDEVDSEAFDAASDLPGEARVLQLALREDVGKATDIGNDERSRVGRCIVGDLWSRRLGRLDPVLLGERERRGAEYPHRHEDDQAECRHGEARSHVFRIGRERGSL